MNATDMILSATGKPFRDHDAASLKASVLADELGQPFRVVDHPAGGYAVVRATTEPAGPLTQPKPPAEVPDDPWQQSQNPAHHVPIVNLKVRRQQPDVASVKQSSQNTDAQQQAAKSPNNIALHPAWRAFWGWHVLLVVAAIATLNPYFFLNGVMRISAENVDAIAHWGMLPMLSLIGAILMATAIIYSTYGYFANRYYLTPVILETRAGIWAQDAKRIEYRHIRSVNVRRGVIERILGIGNIEVSTAATDGGDLVLFGVSNPLRVQEEIERRKLMMRHTRQDDPGE